VLFYPGLYFTVDETRMTIMIRLECDVITVTSQSLANILEIYANIDYVTD